MELGISVICCTNRKDMIKNILSNFLTQDYCLKELILLLNFDVDDFDKVFELVAPYDNIRIYRIGSKRTLGECLNFGVEKSRYDIIAKFDDDDYYAPKYLSDSVKYLNLKNVGIVGKSCIFVYFSESKLMGIRNVTKENKYVSRVAGSTLIFKKELFKKIRFRHVNLGEDIRFCADCIKSGYRIYSTNRYHYLYIRNKSHKHTWKISNQYIMRECTALFKVEDYKEFLKFK
jgi:glycosyltransferase involved in cell wall biosynthesis